MTTTLRHRDRRPGRVRRALRATTLLAAVASMTAAIGACGLASGSTPPFTVGAGSIKNIPALDGVKVTVGSKEFTEQVILGYIIEFSLMAAGADVRDLTSIVGSRSTRDSQTQGQVDITYEYTGTGWINYLGNEKPIPDATKQFEAVRDEDLKKNDIVWTAVAPMDNTYALAASPEVIKSTGVKTLSEYGALVNKNPGAAQTCLETEFRSRQDGFPGVASTYGFPVTKAQVSILQTGIIYQATADASQCKFGEVFTTDGRIKALGLQLLTDDKQFFPHYNAAIVMREAYAKEHPDIAKVMTPVSDKLTNDVITDLNLQVDVQGKEPAEVARDWLVKEGFVSKESS
ncbi:glycine/betaine ABC transporter substrate-binding protein [Williamsia phyllosphaerae]|uniref:Glycine/betaine ABC transporter substrate-binding protein n=2 Tax=Williamsia phyllosphaerae TaxID=885042 RepID=A0ABQ1UDC0_9NOCA|nr:glycine/betaine ABC transporter substrate-binding protein [Williamsia phyllosphaerae]